MGEKEDEEQEMRGGVKEEVRRRRRVKLNDNNWKIIKKQNNSFEVPAKISFYLDE